MGVGVDVDALCGIARGERDQRAACGLVDEGRSAGGARGSASEANFAPNAPQEPKAAREEMRHAQATSQKAEAPPLPRTTS